MKKIILSILSFSLVSFSLVAQDINPNASKKSETTINGIPYSQYKAQQLALQNKKATTSNIPAGIGMSNVKGNAQPNKVAPAQQVNEVNPNGPSSIRDEENKQNAAKQADLLKVKVLPKTQPVNTLPVPDFSNPASLGSVRVINPDANVAIPVAGNDGKTVAPNFVNG